MRGTRSIGIYFDNLWTMESTSMNQRLSEILGWSQNPGHWRASLTELDKLTRLHIIDHLRLSDCVRTKMEAFEEEAPILGS